MHLPGVALPCHSWRDRCEHRSHSPSPACNKVVIILSPLLQESITLSMQVFTSAFSNIRPEPLSPRLMWTSFTKASVFQEQAARSGLSSALAYRALIPGGPHNCLQAQQVKDVGNFWQSCSADAAAV